LFLNTVAVKTAFSGVGINEQVSGKKDLGIDAVA
jgi:hypothetical protein